MTIASSLKCPSPVVSFTNMCASVPEIEPYDFEFGQYYSVLQAIYPDRLVPDVTHLGDAADCDIMCSVDYERS